MPEAPEVQTVLSTLETQIQNLKILKVDVFYEKILADPSIKELLVGQSFLQFHRIGKYLIFITELYDFIVHLRMEGKFYLLNEIPKEKKHIHVIFSLSDGRFLCYHDTRKFGRMELYPKQEDKYNCPALKKVGWDVLDERYTPMYLYSKIHTSKRSLKAVLLDQSIQAGIGNIYADEICFASRLDPRTRAYRLSKKDCQILVKESKRILAGAMKYGGTTIRSYTSSLGVTGLFQLKLHVHTKEGCPCDVCSNPVIKTFVNNRGTYICTHCQKRK